ncbi:hypothetical protein LTR96_011912, partial [Exophiala xenobiotica]
DGNADVFQAKEQYDAVYAGLSVNQKSAVDRAMEYAQRGDFKNANATFVSDMKEMGIPVSMVHSSILESHTSSVELYRDGLVGFFSG